MSGPFAPRRRLRLGFIPLNDAAAMIAAHELGYFAIEGLEVELSREMSWATIRDKVAFGALDGAHMLAPLALAMSLGVAGGDATPLIAPMALALNGPAITLAARLAGAVGPGLSADGLARLVARRRAEGASPITLAVVFPYSAHNDLLRDWLAAAGIDPDRDVRLVVAPPPRMAELLGAGTVEGFCVGEPWNAAAVAAGAGTIVVRGSQLWPRLPDKVFAVAEGSPAHEPEVLQELLRALLRGAAWADDPENRADLAALLAQRAYVGVDTGVVAAGLSDIVFHADGANAPWPVHAGWLLAQMMRWGRIAPATDIAAVAGQVYRPDLYSEAALALDLTPREPPDVLEGYGGAGGFRLSDAADYAAHAPMSRMSRR
jgi:NitT/TauT family transport system ATP-binding protein/nitrate/nitrite transport system substrate-binding protein